MIAVHECSTHHQPMRYGPNCYGHTCWHCPTCDRREIVVTRWLALGFLAALILLGYLAYWLEPITPTGVAR